MRCPVVQVSRFLRWGSLTHWHRGARDLTVKKSRSHYLEEQAEAGMMIAIRQAKYHLSQKLTVLPENKRMALLPFLDTICEWQSETTVPPTGTSPRRGGGSRRGHSTSADRWVQLSPCLFITTTKELTMKCAEQNGSLRGEGIFSEAWCSSMSDGEQEQVILPPIRVPVFLFSSPLCSVWRLELLEFQVGMSKALFSITSVQYHLPEKCWWTPSACRVLFVLDDWLRAHRTVGIFNVIVLPQRREIEFLHLCFSKCCPG